MCVYGGYASGNLVAWSNRRQSTLLDIHLVYFEMHESGLLKVKTHQLLWIDGDIRWCEAAQRRLQGWVLYFFLYFFADRYCLSPGWGGAGDFWRMGLNTDSTR